MDDSWVVSGPWTAEDDTLLRKLIAEGYSAKQAGESLHRSKNACIGRAFRLNLHFKGQAQASAQVTKGMRRMWAAMTPEQRQQRGKRSWESRRAAAS